MSSSSDVLDGLLAQARAALETGDGDAAEAVLRRCLACEAHHGAAHHLLGKALWQRGRSREALHHQLLSCRWDPHLGWNWFAAAELLQHAGRWRTSADFLQRAAALLPADQDWIEELARSAWLRAHCDGEDLAQGLGPATYRFWIQNREPRLPDACVPLLDSWWRPEQGTSWPTHGWMLLLAPEARLRLGALQVVEQWLADQPVGTEPHLIYADEDRLDEFGHRCDPWFKPGWSEESFWATPWLHLFSIWNVAWLRSRKLDLPPADSLSRFDWILNALTHRPRIGHIPKVLVHGAQATDAPALQDQLADRLFVHLRSTGEAIDVVKPVGNSTFQLRWRLPQAQSCEVIIPTRDRADLLASCLEQLWTTTAMARQQLRLRITIVDNGSQELATRQLLERWQARLVDQFRVITDAGSFNWSRLNNGAASSSRADLLLFLNNDVEALSCGWLEPMAAHAARPIIGCVGAVLTYPDGSLQHAGVVVGMNGGADHAYRQLPLDHSVHRSRSRFLSNWGSVTGACLMVRRDLFIRMGGFDEHLPVEFNDVDFCLRLGAVGYRHVVVPDAVLRHHESMSRDARGSQTAAAALQIMRRRWKARLQSAQPWWPEAAARNCSDGRPRELDPQGWWLGDQLVGAQGDPWASR